MLSSSVCFSDKPERAILFKGADCYPLSPTKSCYHKVSKLDQLRVIIKQMGKQSKDNLCYLDEASQKHYEQCESSNAPSEEDSFLRNVQSKEPALVELMQ